MPSMRVGLFKSASSPPRPKSRHQSIRGRISGPIPITSTTDDDEFPIRKPGTAYAATEPPGEDEEFPIRQPGAEFASTVPIPPKEGEQSSEQSQAPQAGVSEHGVEAGTGEVPEPPSNPPPAPPPGSTPSTGGGGGGGAATSPAVLHRTNPSSTLRFSQVSAASTKDTAQTGNGRPQRKKSTLRGALSRLFGRRKKTGSQVSTDTSGGVGTQQHRSCASKQDLSALSRAKEGEPKRSASLPITEYDRALRSHSIGPGDITAIESARNSIQAEPGAGRKRAATTSSRLFTYPRRGELGEWLGLSPRPASTHGRGSQLLSAAAGQDDPNEIGRAITSDVTGDMTHRRRSRSLSDMNDVIAGGRPQGRRRSDEIRYWRESYDPGFTSPLSSGNEGDNGDYGDDTGAVSVSVPGSPAADRPPKTPPQPFTFGSIANMNELAGMKITQAASLDTRIGSLESRMYRLERVVEQLCHSVPGFKGPLAELGPQDHMPRPVPPPHEQQAFAYTTAVPPTIPAIYQTASANIKGGSSSSRPSSSRHSAETDAHSHMSFGDGQTYIGSLHPPSSSATQAQSLLAPSPADRPTSTSTVRGAASLPTLVAGRAGDEVDPLAQLEAERAARQALEAQVKKLSDRVNSLSTTMFAMVRDPPKARSQERLAVATTPTTTPMSAPATAAPTSACTPSFSLAIPPPPNKPRSVFDEDSDVEDRRGRGEEGVAPGAETPSEVFQTPTEERPQYGAFGEELREREPSDDPRRKKAARTLSLSQLSLGRGTQM